MFQGTLQLLPAQFTQDQLRQFNVTEVPRDIFQQRLHAALASEADLLQQTSSEDLTRQFLAKIS
ncbi:MAG: hypothetical protein VW665_09655 [Candidatus Puniceispirillum sp.]